MVLTACLSMLGLDADQWPLLICDACNYWEGLLVVGEEDLGHFGIMSSKEPEEEAQAFIDRGYIHSSMAYGELQEFTRSLIQRYFILGMDRYGELLLECSDDEEYAEGFIEEEEDD